MATLHTAPRGLDYLYEGQVVGDLYEIQGKYAHGGMGLIYKARYLLNDKEVLVKSCNPEFKMFPDIYTRFLNEVSTTSRLSHPGIVSTYQGFELDEAPFLVLERIPFSFLHFFKPALGDHGQFAQRIYFFLEQLADVVEYLASEEVVHRDISKDNLCTTLDEKLKLIDFGIAHDGKSPYNLPKQKDVALGKLTSITPEMIQGFKEQPLNSDVYSVAFNALLFTYNHMKNYSSLKELDDRSLEKCIGKKYILENDDEICTKTYHAIQDGTLVRHLLQEVSPVLPSSLHQLFEAALCRFYRYRMNAGEFKREVALIKKEFA